MTPLLGGLAAFGLLVPAPPQAVDPSPDDVPPSLQFFQWDGGRKFEMTVAVPVYTQQQRTATVKLPTGQLQTQTYTVNVLEYRMEKRSAPLETIEVYDADGKKMPEGSWKKVLEGGVIVAVVEGRLPHPTYRKALAQGTLIVVRNPVDEKKAEPKAVEPMKPKREE
jgi:hypothetical protein